MDEKKAIAYKKIVAELARQEKPTAFELSQLKRKMARERSIGLPKNSELIPVYHELIDQEIISINPSLEQILLTRRVRSLSGVAVVSVLTKPYRCPGKCLYCPGQRGVPKSYLKNEPAVMRAIDNKYDPYRQTYNRIKALEEIGHPTDKIELIVIGGTWSCFPKRYQDKFISRCFEAANQEKSHSLAEAQQKNIQAKHRIVSLTLETRPDYINEKEILQMRKLGATKVELGVQCLNQDILSFNRRGHGLEAVVAATKLLKEAGFKVGYHLMLNLPGATIEEEKGSALRLFSSQEFRPDFLKIYPTAIVAGAPLYKMWKRGEYQPYSKRQLIDLIKFVKRNTPRYCRIQRVIRDIPSESVPVGPVRTTNLRETVLKEMKEESQPCHCIRCREIKDHPQDFEPFLFREDYDSSEGKEIFLTFEDKGQSHLLALLRLRIPAHALQGKNHFIETLKMAALIREVHTYGQHLAIGKQSPSSPQHQGLGKKLINLAEQIIEKEYSQSIEKIAVIAGVGTREYYRRLDYELQETYMVKNLSKPKGA
jgi:elongator complex protein 3